MGLRLDDFHRMYVREFEEAMKAWQEGEQERERSEWERVRMLAAVCIQPHVRSRVDPRRLMPFPWDRETEAGAEERDRPLDREQSQQRFRRLMGKGQKRD